jgi:hypothetical protein
MSDAEKPKGPAPHPGDSPGPSSQGAANAPGGPRELTPEEQMALYEKDLKENDWGHQPC